MILLSFFTLLCVFSSRAEDDDERKAWIQAVDRFDVVAHPFKQEFAGHLVNISNDTGIRISDQCRRGMASFATGLLSNKYKEMAMFDSFSKMQPGSLTFQGYNLGSYDQCLMHARYVYLGIEFPVPRNTSVKKFEARDDDWRISWSKGIGVRRIDPYHFGLCAPDPCLHQDLDQIFASEYVTSLVHPLRLRVMTAESKSDPVTKTGKQMIAMLAIAALFAVAFVSSFMNYLMPGTWISHLLSPFDAYTNMMDLFAPPSHPESMYTTINIFRANYFVFSVYMHVMIGTNLGTELMRAESSAAGKELTSPFVRNLLGMLTYATPSILSNNMVLASCFAVIKWIPIMRKQRVNFMTYALERILRTGPVIGVYLLVIQTLPITNHGGPIMRHAQIEYADICSRNGWKELMFVDNFDDVREICLPVAWFMSAEFQLYCLAFIVMMLVARFPRHAYKILTLQILAGMLATGYLFQQTNVKPIFVLEMEELYDDVRQLSSRIYHTVNYIPVYGIGMMLGYIMLEQKGVRRQLHPVASAILMSSFVILMPLSWLFYDGDTFAYGPRYEVVFVSVLRSIAAIVTAGFFYALFNNNSSMMLQQASSMFITLISRLSLSWFVTHSLVIVLTIASYESTGASGRQMFMEMIYILIVSFIPASLMYVMVEAPVAKILAAVKSSGSRREGKKRE